MSMINYLEAEFTKRGIEPGMIKAVAAERNEVDEVAIKLFPTILGSREFEAFGSINVAAATKKAYLVAEKLIHALLPTDEQKKARKEVVNMACHTLCVASRQEMVELGNARAKLRLDFAVMSYCRKFKPDRTDDSMISMAIEEADGILEARP